jgi:hypothetical protein
MATADVTALGGTNGATETLSTGHQVRLPLSTHASITGAVLSADRDAVRRLLPAGVEPVPVSPSRAAVTFLCVDYDRIGRRGEIEPYNEFGVVLPAVHGDPGAFPLASVLTQGVSGFVWYLPVTSEPATALGVDIWGYPKEVADITHREEGSTRHTSVHVDGQHLIDISVDRPPTVSRTDSGASYTTMDGQVLRERTELNGDIGVWPYSDGISYALGDHPRAETLRGLDLSDRALLRFAADTEFVIHEGEPVE